MTARRSIARELMLGAAIAALGTLLIVAAIVLWHWLRSIGWLWHPLGECVGTPAAVVRCRSYNWWSGLSGSDITVPFSTIFAVTVWYLHHQCEEPGCLRMGHPHNEHGRPVCRSHYLTHQPPQAGDPAMPTTAHDER
jgi:hypothetical protein